MPGVVVARRFKVGVEEVVDAVAHRPVIDDAIVPGGNEDAVAGIVSTLLRMIWLLSAPTPVSGFRRRLMPATAHVMFTALVPFR